LKISIVASVYNEEKCIEKFFLEVLRYTKIPATTFEYIFVDDGSVDSSYTVMKSLKKKHQDLNIKLVKFSRNFGHEAAMIAGIDTATGDCCICLDSDLQHPPALIPEMIEGFKAGNEVILMARRSRMDRSFLYNIPSKLFYKIINKISNIQFIPQASDFFLISANVAKILKVDYRERIRFIRGIIQSIGFNRKIITYDSNNRIAGSSKYGLLKLVVLSFSAIASFSHVPLKLGLFAGAISGFFSFAIVIYSILKWFQGLPPEGYTTIVVLISALFSILFFLIGIIGEYIGFIFSEIKSRPIYIVSKETE
jgi:dolichol-phosphate mannosyltransferase